MPTPICFCAGSNHRWSRLAKLLSTMVLVLATDAVIAESWTKKDSQRQWLYLSTHSMDWLQTRYIANHPEVYYETNPILGEQPSQEKVDSYFLSTALLHSWIAYSLPANYRKWFQYSTIVMETGYVGHNVSLGIGFQF